jgi:hypothetical protein
MMNGTKCQMTKCRIVKNVERTKRRMEQNAGIDIMSKVKKADWDKMSNGKIIEWKMLNVRKADWDKMLNGKKFRK